MLQRIEPFFPKFSREKALDLALDFIKERLNGEDGLGGIFPAMVNAVIALQLMGYDKTRSDVLTAKQAIRKLLVIEDDQAYCQPCLSPIWDYGACLPCDAGSGGRTGSRPALRGLDWLVERQITDVVGDWASKAPAETKPEGGGSNTRTTITLMSTIRRPLSAPCIGPIPNATRMRSNGRWRGSLACSHRMAAGVRSMSTTLTII